MSFLELGSFSSGRGLPEASAAKIYARAALCLLLAGMTVSAFPAESLSETGAAIPLKNVVAEALRNNPEVQAARKEREAAQHRVATDVPAADELARAGGRAFD